MIASRARRAAVVLVAALALPAAIVVRAAPQKTTRDQVYSKDQAASGEKQYAQLCASCHDPAKVPPGKKPGPVLVGDVFLTKWNGKTLGDLLTNIETTMPNDGSAVLDDDQTAELVAYILQANGFPPGTAPLTNTDPARSVVIVPVK